jgi:hypothetical protein
VSGEVRLMFNSSVLESGFLTFSASMLGNMAAAEYPIRS